VSRLSGETSKMMAVLIPLLWVALLALLYVKFAREIIITVLGLIFIAIAIVSPSDREWVRQELKKLEALAVSLASNDSGKHSDHNEQDHSSQNV